MQIPRYSWRGRAWLESRTGLEDACRRDVAEALTLAERHHVHLARIWAIYALGDLELGAGRPTDALAHYGRMDDARARGRLPGEGVGEGAAVGQSLGRAGAMFLSPKTVESPCRHVYTKLGVNNRTNLAGALAAERATGGAVPAAA